MNERTDFKRCFAAALDRGAADAGRWDPRRDQHPRIDDLVAYQHRELAPVDADAVQEHLAICRPCATLVADMTAFPDLEEQPGEPSEHEVAQAWRRFAAEHLDAVRPAAAAVTAAAAPPTAVAPPTAAAPWHRAAVAWVAAACLALACLALGTWNQRLEGSLAELSAPRPNVQLVDLGYGNTSRGPGDEPAGEPTTVPAAGDSWVLLWFYPDLGWDHYATDFEWILDDERGEALFRGHGLERGSDGFTLTLDRSRLPPGVYRLHLLGVPKAGGPAQELASFDFQLGEE